MRLIFHLFLFSLFTICSAKPAKNLILILADDLGWADTTLYGKTSLYETPNIERLAKRGMKFSNAYSSPICSPTRASILTGQNPARHGMTSPSAHLPEVRLDVTAQTRGLPHQKSCKLKTPTRIRKEVPTLGEILKNNGYQTAHFGKWHLGREGYTPLENGFDIDLPHWHGPGPKSSYLAPWGYSNPDFAEGATGEHIEDRMAKEATTWLKKRDSNKPFFLNYWQFSVHAPFGAKPELIDYYRKKIKRSSRQQSPTYAAMVHSLDDAVGVLLDALDAEGLTDDTVVVFYSDNGGNIHCGLEETDAKGKKYVTAITSNYPLRGGKGTIREGGIRVPAVVAWPGVTMPGSVNETRIQANDLYPSILKMLDLSYPENHVIDGIDFTNALKGKTFERKPMFTFVPGYGNTPDWLPPSMAVHHGKWKFIRTFYYGENGKHQYWLHDLENDIGEKNNLASKFPDKVKEMDRLIDEYIAEANVVVPLPNPDFDPVKFEPSLIGVQAGGLKMPPVKKTSGSKGPPKTVRKESMLGWIGKGMDISTDAQSMKISSTHAQPFLTNASLNIEGPVLLKIRFRSAKPGKANLQYRTTDQKGFPTKGQSKQFSIKGGDWQEIEIKLPVKGVLQHLRIFIPDSKKPFEIDWIEITPVGGKFKQSERWDFGEYHSGK